MSPDGIALATSPAMASTKLPSNICPAISPCDSDNRSPTLQLPNVFARAYRYNEEASKASDNNDDEVSCEVISIPLLVFDVVTKKFSRPLPDVSHKFTQFSRPVHRSAANNPLTLVTTMATTVGQSLKTYRGEEQSIDQTMLN
ncbi:hypothetical protein BLOT_004112 [Blomia tropicalis]|nr:hypothetical protein BLOT_004112 [Blomia tropicalis]